MILADVSSGRSLLRHLLADEAGEARIGRSGGVLDRRAAAFAGRRKGRGAHRDDLLGILRLHGLDGVAGIDRPLEGVGGDHLDDLGHLHDVEQRGDARHHVLEARGRGRDERVIGRRQRHDQRSQRLGEVVGVSFALGDQHLLDAGEPGRGLGRRLGALAAAGDQHMHVAAQLGRGGQRLVGGVLQGVVVVFGNQQRRHQSTPASVLSFDTSSATSFTLTPPLRPGGSDVLRISRCGVRSTP